MVEATTPLLAPRSEPGDARFAVRSAAQHEAVGITQQALASRARIYVTQDCRYHAGISQPTLGVLRAKGSLRLTLEAVDLFTPEEQEHVAAFIEGAQLRHHARQAFSGQAS